MLFDSLGLNSELLSAVASRGYTEPTPIQASAIPAILEGADILGGAQTGTGKTAAFALPIVQMLGEQEITRKRRIPRALVLVPTRELAAQVSNEMNAYARRLSLRSTMIYGGVTIQAQIERLHRGVDIVVATPGRLLDHAERGTVNLSTVQFLVLDEADRMLDLGFIDDIMRVSEYLPKKRQTLLFSATYSASIKRLADDLLDRPRRIEVERKNIAADPVTQAAYMVEKSRKREMISFLIRQGGWNRVLVFVRTRYGADKLTEELLYDGIKTAAIHSNKSQSIRNRTLSQFREGELRVLVATDVAARGLDIERLPHVVNYDLPQVPEDYVHRIGRTGRAGESGEAISLVAPEEKVLLAAIEKLLTYPIPRRTLAEFPEVAPRRSLKIREQKAAAAPGKKKTKGKQPKQAGQPPAGRPRGGKRRPRGAHRQRPAAGAAGRR
ncbi:DEAD/DEAH box helicase [Geobacter sp. SVR]|uniref:DEAD/DEAH box helicase n=1 Tax=Geobacter sp. SVR TaxID=2495594 RepID=UPI00143EF8B7|nr:DEAD/DEAH box helicase [Geobacter sp. SVR]BCS55430.1 ATP-dependent RNA helicase RhlE [Geobacter sp. SVR]GCF83432.1 ATP-dependent RNA helicase RhlE [Geobacter sp. SVR]